GDPARGGLDGDLVEEPAALPRRLARRLEHLPGQISRVHIGCEVPCEHVVHAILFHAAPPLTSADLSRLFPRWSWLFTVLIEMPRLRASSPYERPATSRRARSPRASVGTPPSARRRSRWASGGSGRAGGSSSPERLLRRRSSSTQTLVRMR